MAGHMGASIIAAREAKGEKTTANTDTRPARRDEAVEIWERARQELRGAAPSSVFDLWLKPLEAIEISGRTLLLAGPERVLSWVGRRYADELRVAVTRCGEIDEIRLTERVRTASGAPSPPLPASYTFESFVIGAGNRVAHAAALAVAELPGEAYNPLFLYGMPGLGKTHLMGAIANYLRTNHPLLASRYTSAERFTAEFVTALRSGGADAFKQLHRDVAVLLIDDVQFLEGKQHTEEEFFHTFNELYEAGHQIVLSSDRPPHALKKLTDRLRNRFEWGLAVEVGPPDYETRAVLVERLIEFHELEIEDAATRKLIASLPSTDVRQLEGALMRVAAQASVLGSPPSVTLARSVLVERTSSSDEPLENIVDAVQTAVCRTLRIPRSDLLSSRRTPDVVRARQVAIYLVRELTELSLAEIGRHFDRDHSTIVYAIRMTTRKLNSDPELSTLINNIRREAQQLDGDDR